MASTMKKERVLLAMSGGVDSTVAAWILQQAGHEVLGVTFRFWNENDDFSNAKIPGYIKEASLAAKKLGVDHLVIDKRKEFKSIVVKYFIQSYMKGETPFPCAVCNPALKWKSLANTADQYQCTSISTGHYAGIHQDNDKIYIRKALDETKDQSFFLWNLPWEYLGRAVFPLGGLQKNQVKALAEKIGLKSFSDKKESTGICFLSDPDYRKFLEKLRTQGHIEYQPGQFLDDGGCELGNHAGYPLYTVGQRRGLGVHLNKAMYVSDILPESNKVVLSPREKLYKSSFSIAGCCFVTPGEIEKKELIVKIRYRKQENRCQVKLTGQGMAMVLLKEPLHMIAPGQTAVFYDGDIVVGGGFILKP